MRSSPASPARAAGKAAANASARVVTQQRTTISPRADSQLYITEGARRRRSMVQHLGEELPRAIRLRRREELRGGRLLDDPALVHEDDPVRRLAREPHLVSDDHHGHAVPSESRHHVEHLVDHLRVERRGGLVEQHADGVERQAPGDGDTLLLPAGELSGVLLRVPAQAHPVEQGERLLPGRLALASQHLLLRDGQVFHHVHVREQLEVLEDHADACTQLRQVGAALADRDAVHHDLAALERLQAVDALDQRALARTRRAAHHDHLALADLDGAPLEHFHVAVRLVDVADRNHARTLRRRKRTPHEAAEQSTKYTAPANSSISTRRPSRSPTLYAAPKKSARAETYTSEVSWNRMIAWVSMSRTMLRNAWGSTTCHIACSGVIPSASAAERWPLDTLWMPARMIKGQRSAALALGMTPLQAMWHVVLPQAFRNMVPLLLTQAIILFQDTSLVYVSALADFFGAAYKVGDRDGRLVEMLLFAGAAYFVLCCTASWAVRLLRRRVLA